MSERAVWPALIVVDAPGFDRRLRIRNRRELVDVQALVAEPPVERFNEWVIRWFSGAGKFKFYTMGIGSTIQRNTNEFGTVIHSNDLWRAVNGTDTVQILNDPNACKAGVEIQRQILAVIDINDGKAANSTAIG